MASKGCPKFFKRVLGQMSANREATHTGALPFLFRIPLKSPEGGAYVPHKEGTAPVATLMSVEDIMGATSRLEVSEQAQGSKFVPVWMEIKAPSNVRGKVPARICLLGRDRITYKVFAVPDEFHMF